MKKSIISSTNKISILDDDTVILQTNTDDMKAVGVVYNDNEILPQVSQSEIGRSAKILVDNAFKLGIKVKQDPDLTEVLSALEIGQYIPPQAFEAVAEIIFYLYRESGIQAPLLDFDKIMNDHLQRESLNESLGESISESQGYKTSMKNKKNPNHDNDELSIIDHRTNNKFIEIK